MDKVVNANNEELKNIISTNDGLVLVDFWAPWCGPCRMLGPALEQAVNETDGATVVKVNVDENPQSAADYGIRNIPVVLFFKGGEEINKFVGLKKKEEIISMINKHQGEKVDE